ncbi:MAG: hypothetical protein ACI9SC_000915 [Gammaproteobacteria bacterium]|jgi:hypothetical protein
MKKLKCLGFFLILSVNIQVIASPTGADVLAACEESLAKGFQGTTGMMCVWYVTPCDCNYGKDPAIPRVCLPDYKEPESLAREVIEGLTLRPELQSEPAEVASSIVLAEKYPCD